MTLSNKKSDNKSIVYKGKVYRLRKPEDYLTMEYKNIVKAIKVNEKNLDDNLLENIYQDMDCVDCILAIIKALFGDESVEKMLGKNPSIIDMVNLVNTIKDKGLL